MKHFKNLFFLIIIFLLINSQNLFSQTFILESTEDEFYQKVQEDYPDLGTYFNHPDFKKIDIHNVLKKELDSVLEKFKGKNLLDKSTTIWYIAFVNSNGKIDKLFISFPNNFNKTVKDEIYNHFQKNLNEIITLNPFKEPYEIAIPGSIRKL